MEANGMKLSYLTTAALIATWIRQFHPWAFSIHEIQNTEARHTSYVLIVPQLACRKQSLKDIPDLKVNWNTSSVGNKSGA